MAKKQTAPTPRFEAAGWTFFLVLTLVMCIPCSLAAWFISYDSTEWYTRIGMGITFAALLSAILTWLTNSALQYRAGRLKRARRRRGGKRK